VIMKRFLLLVIVIALAGTVVHYAMKAGFATSPYEEFYTNVTEVIDGDTIELEGGERLRLLGINAPERGQPQYSEAKELLEFLVLNEEVLVQSDLGKEDRYDRYLGYVFVGEVFVNRELLEEGLAVSWFIEPNFRYKEELEAAEEEAKEGKGLWNLGTTCLAVEELHYNAEGDDRYNLNDEYVVFSNSCNETLKLEGWTIKDSSNKVYKFSGVSLSPGSTLTLHSGKGEDNATDIFWDSGRAVWNNDADVLYVQEPSGKIALEYSYP